MLASLTIREHIGDIALEKEIKLSARLGLGVGKVNILQVGGVLGRIEYVLTGEPMEQATEAIALTDHPDSIAIPKAFHDLVENHFTATPIGTDRSLDSRNGPFYQVVSTSGQVPPSKPSAQILKSSLQRSEPSLLKSLVQPYVFPGLLGYIEMGMENWFCNLSEVTILSARLDIDLTHLRDQTGNSKFNDVVVLIQKILIQTQGILIKLFCDFNCTNIIAIWNTHSTSSPESCAQAVCAGKRLLFELSRISIPVSVGIASGKVFAGIVGVGTGRREFSVIGDALYLANRLTLHAYKSEHLKIIIDEATAHGSQNRIVCKFNEQLRVKAKGELINTYFPEDTTKRHRLAITRAADGETTTDILSALEDSQENLLIHQILSIKLQSLDLFQEQKKKLLASIKERDKQVLLVGPRGIGKSRLVQDALVAARDTLMMDPYLLSFSTEPHQYNEHFEGLINLYQRLVIFARTEMKDFTTKEEEFIKKFLRSAKHCYSSSSYPVTSIEHIPDFVQAISEQTGLEIKIAKRKYLHVTELQECASMVMEALLNYMAEAVQTHFSSRIVLVLDNFQLLGGDSIKVLAAILPRVDLTLISIVTLETGSKGYPWDVPRLEQAFSSTAPQVIHLRPLPGEKLARLFNTYCSNRFDEPDCVLSAEVSDYIITRTHGNTLTALSFLDALYSKDYISNRGTKKVTSTDRFKEVLDNSRGEEFVVTPVTLVREKGSLLNTLSISELSLLFLASTFGESFDDSLVEEVNFFPMLQGNNIKVCLERLCRSGLIECLGPQQDYRPYRFTQPIMKNIIYERMLCSHRRLIHKQYREHFKINPIPQYILYGLDPQVQSLIAENTLHFHFTQSSQYRNDKKNYDKLVIELIKANVIHDCHKAASPTDSIFSCQFGKFSSDETKPPQSRYLVVTSHYFSYYASEEKQKDSEDLYVLRVSHSDIAEVVFSVSSSSSSTIPEETTLTKSACLPASAAKESIC